MREVFFLDAPEAGHGGGQRLCIHHTVGQPRAAMLYIHPFAEEMNKSRRMAAQQARAFSELGIAVLQIDLQGCGDSSGDFGDASWAGWLADVALARQWLKQQHPGVPLYLWGLRAGCLLASQSARAEPGVAGQLWWQPPASGKVLSQQWLRLKIAGEMIGGTGKASVEALRQQLREGQSLEIAGYRCSPGLMHGLEQASLVAPQGERLAWFELSREVAGSLLPVSAATLERWQVQDVQADAVVGPAFWQTAEIETAPALIERSNAWVLTS